MGRQVAFAGCANLPHGQDRGPTVAMTRSFSLFLARRYLKPRGAFVWVINAISILGVVLGVAILIVVLAVMKGFELVLKDTLLSYQPHLYVINDPVARATPYREIAKLIQEHPEVESVSPMVYGPAIMVIDRPGSERKIDAPMIRGIAEDDPQLKELTKPREHAFGRGESLLVEGSADLTQLARAAPDGSPERINRVIITRSLSKRFQLSVGDEFRLFSIFYFRNFEDASRRAQERNPEARLNEVEETITRTFARRCQVSGIVTSPLNQDQVLTPLDLAQDFFSKKSDDATGPDMVHGIGAFVRDPYDIERIKASLVPKLPPDWGGLGSERPMLSWIDISAEQFELIRSQTRIVMILLFLVTVVAAFCVVNTIIVTTVRKRREIGIMKAIGAGEGQVTGVFVSQGMFVGLIGTALGVGLGLAILPCLNPVRDWLNRHGADPFPEELYKVSSIPTRLESMDVLLISILAVVICTLAAVLPALIAANNDAAKVLRSE